MIVINPSGALIFIDVRLTDWHYSDASLEYVYGLAAGAPHAAPAAPV